MEKREKAPQGVIGVPQFAELSACVIKQLPRDIDPDIAQGWIKNPQALGKALRNAFLPPLSVPERVRASGYLDTSFDGREVYPLTIRPLTKRQAFAEYRNSGGRTWVWSELEKNMPYIVPKAEKLDVMILKFGRSIGDDKALAEMDNLDVRPLIYEQLIQYGIARPEHQKQKFLIGIGTKHILRSMFVGLHSPVLHTDDDGERNLDACPLNCPLGERYRFLVVPK